MLQNATIIFDPSCRASKKVEQRDLKRLFLIDFRACSKLDRAIDDLPLQFILGVYNLGLFHCAIHSLKTPHMAKLNCLYAHWSINNMQKTGHICELGI